MTALLTIISSERGGLRVHSHWALKYQNDELSCSYEYHLYFFFTSNFHMSNIADENQIPKIPDLYLAVGWQKAKTLQIAHILV